MASLHRNSRTDDRNTALPGDFTCQIDVYVCMYVYTEMIHGFAAQELMHR
jgi:hypothetical protein